MKRRKFSREFKVEAVKLVRERGVSVAQAGRDLDVHENVLRKWVKELGADPVQAFPGHGQMKPEQHEIERLRREVAKLKAERDILKKGRSFLREGVRPTDNAIAALHYASDLAPQDIGVRMNSAVAYLHEGKLKEARYTLSVVAYSPHADSAAVVARRMMADIDAGNGKAALQETRQGSAASH